MNALFDVPAPAKINLFLHITGRRSDGYHLMQSVFVLLDVCDTLDFELRHSSAISREDICPGSEKLPAEDLSVRAARLLQAATGSRQGAHIRLDKKIPSQAGMGGGSSDAASCLLALNRLWNTGLTRPQLAQLALQLGADVPFFIFGQNAWAEGIGDQLTAIEHTPRRFAILKPPVGLPTAKIFGDPHLKRDTACARIQGFADNAFFTDQMSGKNDLQPVAEVHCPEIKQCTDWLESQGLTGRMTGSGSAVFALLAEHQTAPAPHPEWLSLTCKSLKEHPLKNWVSD